MRVFALSFLVVLCVMARPARAFDELVWPVDLDQPWTRLSSTFGPRLKSSESFRYDFHRGIDIPGTSDDAVLAAAAGTVHRVYREGDPESPYPTSGTVIILKHSFIEPFLFHGEEQTELYTLYMHLSAVNASVVEGAQVVAGQEIGMIGDSGVTTFSHLHFEVRVGTPCSLESDCNDTGFDPHIHPLTLLPYPQANTARLHLSRHKRAVWTRVSLPYTEVDLNSIQVSVLNRTKERVLRKRRVNFNLRKGIDPRSTATLDQQLFHSIYLDPEQFSASSDRYVLTVRFRKMIGEGARHIRVRVRDVQGNVIARRTTRVSGL